MRGGGGGGGGGGGTGLGARASSRSGCSVWGLASLHALPGNRRRALPGRDGSRWVASSFHDSGRIDRHERGAPESGQRPGKGSPIFRA